MKRGELSRQAARLGITRQALWCRLKKKADMCILCGERPKGKTNHCAPCRRKVNDAAREKWRKANPYGRRWA